MVRARPDRDAFNRSSPWATLETTVAGAGTPGSPTAAFTENSQLVAGSPGSFEDDSQAGAARIVRWAWTFGDGTSASLQNPQHTYDTAGTYTVTLTVTDANGSTDTTSQSVDVISPQPSAAAFQAPLEVTAGDDVSFVDGSSPGTSTIVAWHWTYGDGASSDDENPDHAYTQPGTYTVTLKVTAQDGRQATSSQTITVDPQ